MAMTKELKVVARDVSWMYFNRRILEEATRQSVPALERLGFLGIYSNNLDEFFRVRVASLRRLALCKDKGAKEEAAAAARQLRRINALWCRYSDDYSDAIRQAWQALEAEGISVRQPEDLTQGQRAYVEDFFRSRLAGRVLPLWADNIRTFDKEADDTIYLMVRLQPAAGGGKAKAAYAVLPVPADKMGRWVCLPDDDGRHCVMYLDDVLRTCMPLLFPGIECESYEAYSFKFTRDAEMDVEGDPMDGLTQKVKRGVVRRKSGEPLRLVYDAAMPDGMLRRITARLEGWGKMDTATAAGRYQNHRDLMRFPDFGRSDLRYAKWPAVRPAWIDAQESVFDAIRARDRFLHVPYHSFDGYVRLLDEAAVCPKVKSIKTTLYRLAKDSKVVKALIAAAQNGKKVTASIELLARFDEASNIGWAEKMKDAGVEVLFGVEGLKVHSKITLITFTKGSSIACISTGNFHEGNAAAYTDVLMMTARRNITADVERVFKFMKRPYLPATFKELLVSPNDMKRQLLALIAAETRNHLAGKPAYIRCKVNHITDPDIVAALYDAAQAGVDTDLLVRGNCALADDERLAGHMRIVGIIDRWLEHSRILCFCNNGNEKVFIGSADWMPRNLDCRIEVMTPVYDEQIKAECRMIVDYGLADTQQGRLVAGQADAQPMTPFRSQEELYKHYRDGNN